MTSPADKPYGHPERDRKYMGQDRPESSKIKHDHELLKKLAVKKADGKE
jgi:dCTP deaminase